QAPHLVAAQLAEGFGKNCAQVMHGGGVRIQIKNTALRCILTKGMRVRAPGYCAGFDAISLLSPGLKSTRLGYTGVTSNDILSRTDRSVTGLLLSISMWLSQGSILMRLPSGRAGTWATFVTSRAGACAKAP